MLDLILRGGRVIDPLNSIDGVMDVGFAAGKVWGIAARIDDQAKEIRDVTGTIVTPGLIDLHSTSIGAAPPSASMPTGFARRSGTTTLHRCGQRRGLAILLASAAMSSSRSKVRILAYVNISFPGIFGFSRL